MEPIEVSKLDELLERATSLMNRVEDTYLVAKDILMGTNIADWVADLAASGTGSATYADSERMNALIENTDACRNVNVAQYLLDWAVAQNKANTYFGSALGDSSGVTWESLTSVNAIMANSAAFTAIAGDSLVYEVTANNVPCRRAIFSNSDITEDIIKASDTAMNVMRNKLLKKNSMTGYGNKEFVKNMFVMTAKNENSSTIYAVIEKGGSVIKQIPGNYSGSNVSVNAFADKAYCNNSQGQVYIWYVDFS